MTLQEQLEKLMSETGIKQSEVAKGIGQSDSLVSQWRKGLYKGDTAKVDNAIANFIQRERKKREIKDLPMIFTQTATAKRISAMLESVHRIGGLGLLYGVAGMGKTTTLREYARSHPDVILIEVNITYTPSALLKIIAKKLGLEVAGSLNDINEAILEKLAGSGRMILVDEAEYLSVKSLEILRRIRDHAKVGLVLAGLPKLLSNLVGRRGELAMIYGRVGGTLPLPDKVADGELSQIVGVTLPNLPDSVVQLMVQKACGNPRQLWQLMEQSHSASQTGKVAIDAQMIEEIEKRFPHRV